MHGGRDDARRLLSYTRRKSLGTRARGDVWLLDQADLVIGELSYGSTKGHDG